MPWSHGVVQPARVKVDDWSKPGFSFRFGRSPGSSAESPTVIDSDRDPEIPRVVCVFKEHGHM